MILDCGLCQCGLQSSLRFTDYETNTSPSGVAYAAAAYMPRGRDTDGRLPAGAYGYAVYVSLIWVCNLTTLTSQAEGACRKPNFKLKRRKSAKRCHELPASPEQQGVGCRRAKLQRQTVTLASSMLPSSLSPCAILARED